MTENQNGFFNKGVFNKLNKAISYIISDTKSRSSFFLKIYQLSMENLYVLLSAFVSKLVTRSQDGWNEYEGK